MTHHWLRLPRIPALLLAVLVAAFLSAGLAAHRVSAQDEPDCADPDTVACLTVPAGGDGSTPAPASGSAVAPNAAAAAPAPPAAAPGQPALAPLPCVYPPPVTPYYPPYGVPVPAAGAAAAAAPPDIATYPPPPAPYPCITAIYGAINRANLAYARAMQSLDSSQLSLYWGGAALQDLLGQINDLQYGCSYRVLHLRSIQVVDQSFGPGSARVHTRERWTSETWSCAGYRYDASDAWYDNYYTLTWVGGRWLITTDAVY